MSNATRMYKKLPRKTPLRESPLRALAQWFRSKREAMGMTQTQFAEHLGLTGAVVSALERGDVHVRLSTLLAALERMDGELSVQDTPRLFNLEALLKEEESHD